MKKSIYPSLLANNCDVQILLPGVNSLPRAASSPALVVEVAKVAHQDKGERDFSQPIVSVSLA